MIKNSQTQTKKKVTSTLVDGTQSKTSLPAQVSPHVKGAFTSNRLLHQQVLESVTPDSPQRLTLED
ncbi:MAG: hypothetical protein ACK5T0_06750, partial [Vampirovibrionales bacterium]